MPSVVHLQQEERPNEEAKKYQKTTEEKPKVMTEEDEVREDNKKPYEEDPIPELIPVPPDPNRIDEARNQAGPSTPRPSAQKIPLASDGSESGAKKLKPTVVKPTHDLPGDSPASKRLKSDEIGHPGGQRLLPTPGQEHWPGI